MKIARMPPSRVRPGLQPIRVSAPPLRSALAAVPLDLAASVALALAAASAVLLDGPIPVRVVLGLPLILFVPGYALVSALFPAMEGIDGVERVALGFALSLAEIPLLALVLDRSRWSVSREPIMVALALVTIAASVVATYRRRRRVRGFAIRVGVPRLPPLRVWDRSTRIGVGLMVLALILLVAGGLPAVYARFAGQPMTEFALYNADGQPAFYERRVTLGDPVEVGISITNLEGEETSYVVAIAGAGVAADPVPAVTLADGETWRGPLRFTVNETGERLPLRFELRRAGDPATAAPYRSLRLMVDALPSDRLPADRPQG